jgi:hypothetical protein
MFIMFSRRIINAILFIFLIFGLMVLFSQNRSFLLAEQSGGSPESGSTSRLKTTAEALVTLGYGSTAAGTWGD